MMTAQDGGKIRLKVTASAFEGGHNAWNHDIVMVQFKEALPEHIRGVNYSPVFVCRLTHCKMLLKLDGAIQRKVRTEVFIVADDE